MRLTTIAIVGLTLTALTGCTTSKVGMKQTRIAQTLSEDWAKAPFVSPEASGTTYSPTNALSLARACRLVWETDRATLTAVSKQWGGAFLFGDMPDTHSQYLLFGTDKFTILAFRATQSKAGDIWTVLKYLPYETTELSSVYSHIPAGNAGFRESAADCFASGLVEDIKLFRAATGAKDAPLFIAGHSLGGGVALLVRPKLEAEGIKADSLYVYGCPVSVSHYDDTLGKYRGAFGTTTFFHRHIGDNVPRLRPVRETYSPPGTSFELLPDGTLRDYPSYRTLNVLTSAGWSIPWLTGIVKAHNLEKTYIPALELGSQ